MSLPVIRFQLGKMTLEEFDTKSEILRSYGYTLGGWYSLGVIPFQLLDVSVYEKTIRPPLVKVRLYNNSRILEEINLNLMTGWRVVDPSEYPKESNQQFDFLLTEEE